MMKSRSQVMRLLLGCTERTDHAGIGRKGIEGARNRARRVGVVVGISIVIERALPRPGAGSGRTTTEVHFSRAIEDRSVGAEVGILQRHCPAGVRSVVQLETIDHTGDSACIVTRTELGRQVGGCSEVTNTGIGLRTSREGLGHILTGCRTRIRRIANDLVGDVSRSRRVRCATREDLDVVLSGVVLRLIQPPTEVHIIVVWILNRGRKWRPRREPPAH